MTDDQKPRELPADQWITVGKIAAALSVILFGFSMAILSLVDPPSRCPAWHLRKGEALWNLVWGWTLPLVVISCAAVFFWKRMAQAVIEHEARPHLRNRLPVPVTHFVALMCVMPAVISNLPLAFIVLECGWPFV